MSVPSHGCHPFHLESPAPDYGVYFNSSEFSDLQIIAGDETYRCHKIVLVNRIPYFRKMFAREEALEKVEVNGVAAVSQLKEILRWAYSGKIIISVENAAELLSSSCYFQIDCICEKTVEYVLRNKSTFKGNLIDVFLTAVNYNLIELAQVTRAQILNKLTQVTNDDRFVNMTLGALKTLLIYEGKGDTFKSIARGDVSRISKGETLRLKIIVHPKYILMAIIKWIRADGNRETFAAELLNLVNLMKIPKADVEMICGNLATEGSDSFGPILHRLSVDDDVAQLNPRIVRKMGKCKLFYVTTYRNGFIEVKKHEIKLSKVTTVGDDYYMYMSFGMVKDRLLDDIIGFGVGSGVLYFLLNHEGSYELYKIISSGYLRYGWQEIALPFKEVSASKISIRVMENWTDEFTIFSDFGRSSYISSLRSNENVWITYQLDGHKNFLSQYADDMFDGYLKLCDAPVWKIPHPLGMAASDPVQSACSLAGKEIYVFFCGTQLPQVFDVKNRKWRQKPGISPRCKEFPGETRDYRIVDVDGKLVAFCNDNVSMVIYEYDGNKWRCLQRLRDQFVFVAAVDSDIIAGDN